MVILLTKFGLSCAHWQVARVKLVCCIMRRRVRTSSNTCFTLVISTTFVSATTSRLSSFESSYTRSAIIKIPSVTPLNLAFSLKQQSHLQKFSLCLGLKFAQSEYPQNCNPIFMFCLIFVHQIIILSDHQLNCTSVFGKNFGTICIQPAYNSKHIFQILPKIIIFGIRAMFQALNNHDFEFSAQKFPCCDSFFPFGTISGHLVCLR